MQLELDSQLVHDILLEQLKEANENRYYLMCVIRQLEKNHAANLEAFKETLDQQKNLHHGELAELQAELDKWTGDTGDATVIEHEA